MSRALPLVLLLAACALDRFKAPPPLPPALAEAPPPPPRATGSLFVAASFAALASDNRARRVGDMLTIRLVERTQARKSSSADAARDGKTGIDLPSAPPFSYVPKGLLSGGSTQSFKGSGTAAQDNLLSGEISVTVQAVLPNGVLRVGGEKRLVLNRGEEQLQLSGLVRIVDIGPDNSVASTRVADARIRYAGTGQVADQSRQGWLARFFSMVSPL